MILGTVRELWRYPVKSMGGEQLHAADVTDRGIDGEMCGFVENDWVGRTISIGHDLCLRVTDPAPRCVVPTLPQDQLASEIGILRAIANHNRPAVPALADAQLPCLGVYAVVEQGGTIVVGETVRINRVPTAPEYPPRCVRE